MTLPNNSLITWTAAAELPKAKELLADFNAEQHTRRGRRPQAVAFWMYTGMVGRRKATRDVPAKNIKKGDMVEAEDKDSRPKRIYEPETSISIMRLYANSADKISETIVNKSKNNIKLLGFYVPKQAIRAFDEAYASASDGAHSYQEVYSRLASIAAMMNGSVELTAEDTQYKEELEARVRELEAALENGDSKNGTSKNNKEKRTGDKGNKNDSQPVSQP